MHPANAGYFWQHWQEKMIQIQVILNNRAI